MTAMRTMGLAPVLPPGSGVENSAKEYVVHLRVPGFAQEKLEVEIAGRFVTVRGDQTPRSTRVPVMSSSQAISVA
jgi:HSP20 family molecular chaperone IbpA